MDEKPPEDAAGARAAGFGVGARWAADMDETGSGI